MATTDDRADALIVRIHIPTGVAEVTRARFISAEELFAEQERQERATRRPNRRKRRRPAKRAI